MTIHDWKNNPARTYLDMTIDYGKAHGDGKTFPVINRKNHPDEWRMWLDYYLFRDLKFQSDLMRDRSTHTVPCLSPTDFDPEYRQPGLGTDHQQRFGGL